MNIQQRIWHAHKAANDAKKEAEKNKKRLDKNES